MPVTRDQAQFITLHDAEESKKRFPEGRPIQVRAGSIDTLRGYPDGRTRTVVGVRGWHYHVTETEAQILALIQGVPTFQ